MGQTLHTPPDSPCTVVYVRLSNHQRLVVGEAARYLLMLVLVIVQRAADARGTGSRVVVRVGEPAERALQPAMPLHEVHQHCDQHDRHDRRHDPLPRRADGGGGRFHHDPRTVLGERFRLYDVGV